MLGFRNLQEKLKQIYDSDSHLFFKFWKNGKFYKWALFMSESQECLKVSSGWVGLK